MKHCLISISGAGPGVVDEILAEQGLKREITLRIPHFLAAAHIVANTEFIITLPRRLGILMAKNAGVVMIESPLTLPAFDLYLYWHSRNQKNPLHQWIRAQIAEVTSDYFHAG